MAWQRHACSVMAPTRFAACKWAPVKSAPRSWPKRGLPRLGAPGISPHGRSVRTSLRGADLRGAYLRLARLDGADLSDANLDGVEGLTQEQLNRVHRNSGTKLPVGLTGVEDGERTRRGVRAEKLAIPAKGDRGVSESGTERSYSKQMDARHGRGRPMPLRPRTADHVQGLAGPRRGGNGGHVEIAETLISTRLLEVIST